MIDLKSWVLVAVDRPELARVPRGCPACHAPMTLEGSEIYVAPDTASHAAGTTSGSVDLDFYSLVTCPNGHVFEVQGDAAYATANPEGLRLHGVRVRSVMPAAPTPPAEMPEKDPLLEAIELLFECREKLDQLVGLADIEFDGPAARELGARVDEFTRRCLVRALGEERFQEILSKHPLSGEFFDTATGEADFSNVLLPGSALEGSSSEALARAMTAVRSNVFPQATPSPAPLVDVATKRELEADVVRAEVWLEAKRLLVERALAMPHQLPSVVAVFAELKDEFLRRAGAVGGLPRSSD